MAGNILSCGVCYSNFEMKSLVTWECVTQCWRGSSLSVATTVVGGGLGLVYATSDGRCVTYSLLAPSI